MAARFRITTPVKGFAGKVAGVAFADGAGETSDVGALAYFARHGYGIAELVDEPAESEKTPADDSPKRPANSATKALWKAYAIAQGMPEDQADATTREALAERFAEPKGADL